MLHKLLRTALGGYFLPNMQKMFHQTLTLPGHPPCPRWHWLALGISWAGNVVLLGAVVAMGVWGNFKAMENDGASERTADGSNRSSELEEFQLHFKQVLCEPPSSKFTGSACSICPMNWLVHRGKCYWVSKEKLSWNASYEDCSKKRAQLLMIQDQDEMGFIQTMTRDANWIWLGLTVTSAQTGLWEDGSLFNKTLFKTVDSVEGNSCGVISGNELYFDTCSSVSKWICEKDALLI